jgi:predicted porin
MRLRIALATVPFLACGPTFAQSSATLYGVFDMGLLYMSSQSASPFGYIPRPETAGADVRLKDGGLGASNWGLRGREDLGGGLAATFQLQGNFNAKNGTTGGPNSTGGTSFFNQFSTVGLTGSFGELKFGRTVSPMYYALASTDARAGRYFGSALTALVGMNSATGAFIGNNSNVAFGTVYNDNSVVYNTPAWYGLKMSFQYAFGDGNSLKENSQQSATAIYERGGLRLSGLFYNGYGNNLQAATTLFTAATGSPTQGAAAAAARGFSTTANTNRLSSLGAAYATGPWNFAGAYFWGRNPAHAFVPGGTDSVDMWHLGVGYTPLPHVKILAGYYHLEDNRNTGNDASQLAVGAEYSISKRTTFYVEGARVTNNGANMNLSPVYATTVAANKDVTAVMAGLRHSF